MELSNDLLKLSSKEIQVLNLVASGNSAKEVGAALGISKRTVEQRLSAIMDKLDARSSAHAVAIGIRVGIIA